MTGRHPAVVLLDDAADRLAGVKQRRRGHDLGRVIRDLAVMLADGGECVADLGAVRDQQALFGRVASDSTAFRVIDRVASEPALLAALRAAHARARERFWRLHGAPERLTIDIDATLITAHFRQGGSGGELQARLWVHPLPAYGDETREALAGMLRPGNAGANTAAEHVTVLDRALAQIPADSSRASRSWCGRTAPADARARRLLPRGGHALLVGL